MHSGTLKISAEPAVHLPPLQEFVTLPGKYRRPSLSTRPVVGPGEPTSAVFRCVVGYVGFRGRAWGPKYDTIFCGDK